MTHFQWLRLTRLCLASLCLQAAPVPWAGAGSELGVAFRAEMAAKAAHAEKEARTVVRGKDDWLFLASELRHLGVGPFWGREAGSAGRASTPENADPLRAIVDFKEQLQRVGIDLLFVPIPAKAIVYPEMISEKISTRDGKTPPRLDHHHRRFFEILSRRGVGVVDLVPEFMTHRLDGAGYVFCRQDSHWSGHGCVLAARHIASEIRTRPWMNDIPKRQYERRERTVEIAGDLWRELKDLDLARERLTLFFPVEPATSRPIGLPASPPSPVLLMGNSHCLVFHDGAEMHARGAGLADQLGFELGFPVGVAAVRGSGSTAARVRLARRPDSLHGARIVVWTLSVREFTESHDGWALVPVIR